MDFLTKKMTLLETNILLMVQKYGEHQLRLVVYPTIYKVLYISQVVQDFFHQQYHFKMDGLEEDFFFLKRSLFRGTCQISGGRRDIDVFFWVGNLTSNSWKINSHFFNSIICNFNFVWDISVFFQ